MSENTKIEWCDMTFNPWIGCTKVSPGCAKCFAATDTFPRVQRGKGIELWGKGKPRHRTSEDYWKGPISWNRKAEELANLQAGSVHGIHRRPRVFCASLADWLDDEVPIEWLRDLLVLIQKTPHLDWLLLTKRPENFHARIQAVAEGWQSSCEIAVWWTRGVFPENVWIGTTVEDQKRADERIPLLLSIPARVRFLSCEPLLEAVNLKLNFNGHTLQRTIGQDIHWVIAGGESGNGCRRFDPDWARSLRDQCQSAQVAFFMKQMGGTRKPFAPIPEDLMIREFPKGGDE